MKGARIQIYGNNADPLPAEVEWASIAYENEFAVREELTGELLAPLPDLCLEIHTRAYYAHLMPKGVPKAVYFCNFPEGYYHNEAILDLYDVIFYDNILGENYSRFHSKCRFLPPWLPDRFLQGSGEFGACGHKEMVGIAREGIDCTAWDLQSLEAVLMKYRCLKGSWFLGEPDPVGVPAFLGICLKADRVYVDSSSSFMYWAEEVGTGVFREKDSGFEIVEEPKD